MAWAARRDRRDCGEWDAFDDETAGVAGDTDVPHFCGDDAGAGARASVDCRGSWA